MKTAESELPAVFCFRGFLPPYLLEQNEFLGEGLLVRDQAVEVDA